MADQFYNCSCDPIAPTTDCHPYKCTPFFAVVFPLHVLVLIYLITVTFLMERSVARKGLWRIMLICAISAETAKVIRTGLLLNPPFRNSMNTFLFFLYNTHLCFGSIAFLSLLFYWVRLLHDVARNPKLYGKLLPIYIVTISLVFIFYYLQVIFQAVWPHSPNISNGCKYASAGIILIMAVVFVVYAFFIWKIILEPSNDKQGDLFLKTYISVFVTSMLLIIVCIFTFSTSRLNSTNNYLMKHTIYETLFLSLFLSFPAGFVLHYYKTFVVWKRKSEMNIALDNYSPAPSSPR